MTPGPFAAAIAEGAFAYPQWPNQVTHGPLYPSVPTPCVAAPGGVLQGRFGFYDPSTQYVWNVPTGTSPLVGIVLPQRGTWQRLYFDPVAGGWRVRAGYPVTVCVGGGFWLRFPGGAVAGQACYASTVDGTAISGQSTNTVATPWKVCSNAEPGGLAQVSSTAQFGA
jgi:hypothetical protein